MDMEDEELEDFKYQFLNYPSISGKLIQGLEQLLKLNNLYDNHREVFLNVEYKYLHCLSQYDLAARGINTETGELLVLIFRDIKLKELSLAHIKEILWSSKDVPAALVLLLKLLPSKDSPMIGPLVEYFTDVMELIYEILPTLLFEKFFLRYRQQFMTLCFYGEHSKYFDSYHCGKLKKWRLKFLKPGTFC